MKNQIEAEINIHLYLRQDINKDLIEKIKYLKSRRKLNRIVINLLKEHLEKEEKQLDMFEIKKPS